MTDPEAQPVTPVRVSRRVALGGLAGAVLGAAVPRMAAAQSGAGARLLVQSGRRRPRLQMRPRAQHTSIPLADGRLLLVGGLSTTGRPTASAVIFDVATNTWTPVSPMRSARCRHASAVLADGRVLVLGGQNAAGRPLASAEIYDPARDTWSAAPSMRAPRFDHAAATLPDGRVVVTGGGSPAPVSGVLLFDAVNGAWQ